MVLGESGADHGWAMGGILHMLIPGGITITGSKQLLFGRKADAFGAFTRGVENPVDGYMAICDKSV